MANEIMSVEGQLVGMPLAGPESFSQQQLDYLKRALGVDETVLWEGYVTPSSASTTFNLSETLNNFKRVRFYIKNWSSSVSRPVQEFDLEAANDDFALLFGFDGGSNRAYFCMGIAPNADMTTLTISVCDFAYIAGTTKYNGSSSGIYKVVGIGRIAGGN
jgi:hypothetical protein